MDWSLIHKKGINDWSEKICKNLSKYLKSYLAIYSEPKQDRIKKKIDSVNETSRMFN